MKLYTPERMLPDVSYTTTRGVQIWDLGGDLNWLVTLGHVDPREFAEACEEAAANLPEWRGQSPASFYRDGVDGVMRHTEHTKGQIEVDDQDGDWSLGTSPHYYFPVTQWVHNMSDPASL